MAEDYELVGMGTHMLGDIEGWQITYLMPNDTFMHHIMPPTIFKNYADQFGMDVDDDDDFDEIVDIVLNERFAGNDDPADSIDGPASALMGGSDKKNRLGRRIARRAERGKKNVRITGTDALHESVRSRLRQNRHKGVDDLEARIERVEKQRARRAAVPRADRPDRSNQ